MCVGRQSTRQLCFHLPQPHGVTEAARSPGRASVCYRGAAVSCSACVCFRFAFLPSLESVKDQKSKRKISIFVAELAGSDSRIPRPSSAPCKSCSSLTCVSHSCFQGCFGRSRRVPKLCCPDCGAGCSPSSGFSFPFGRRPKRGKAPKQGRCEERSRTCDIPAVPHARAELSWEVPRVVA